VPELEARGHRTVAPDLPFEDETAGAEAWSQTVVAAIESTAGADENVVVVGHSMAGLCLPVIASRCAVRRMVFLAAQVPVPGRVYLEYLAENPDAVTFDFDAGGTPGPAGMSWEAARQNFYQDLDEASARRAFERLRPTPLIPFTEICPIDRWPNVPSTCIVMTDDRSVGRDWARRTAQGRMHADLIELPGGHSPFYARPVELAEVLVAL
jgi:pimeloyl-ACP methyl ester carboxylesterase